MIVLQTIENINYSWGLGVFPVVMMAIGLLIIGAIIVFKIDRIGEALVNTLIVIGIVSFCIGLVSAS